MLVKLLRERINVVEQSLVLTHKTRRSLRCADEFIIVSGVDVIKCAGRRLVRGGRHGLGRCIYI